MDHEPDEAKKYWASVPFDAYHRDGPQRTLIADALEALRRHGPVESVLEFGCSVGRNLETLRRRLSPPLELVGLDINRSAVEDGKARYGLDLRVGDETALRDSPPSARFDCSFTVSVLDHVADVGRVEAIIAEAGAAHQDVPRAAGAVCGVGRTGRRGVHPVQLLLGLPRPVPSTGCQTRDRVSVRPGIPKFSPTIVPALRCGVDPRRRRPRPSLRRSEAAGTPQLDGRVSRRSHDGANAIMTGPRSSVAATHTTELRQIQGRRRSGELPSQDGIRDQSRHEPANVHHRAVSLTDEIPQKLEGESPPVVPVRRRRRPRFRVADVLVAG